MKEWASCPLSSDMERRIVQLIARGYRNPEIAEILSLSEWTLLNHLNEILNRLGISDRLELMLYGIVNGLVAQTASETSARVQGERSPTAV